ncbi:hypothetical protein F2Q69_00012493 [Brassica cretica]|uniref:DUF632 domain-containing protein n=1 Tax=Brassica cretica TaxID=69181 RepID=A0A8S9QU34_BRACR|nr:hypothetical protein F2Q69_00012493 [Brassica cretica]
MGASTSRIDEDKALQLCRERKKFVQQALDGRCLLAAAHVSYVQSLRSTGTALRRFAETEVPVESSLYTSTSATPEQALALTEKSVSHLSYSPPPSSPPPPPSSSPFQVNHMKFRGFSSKKVEEKPPVPVVATVSVTSSSSVPRSRSMEKMESSTPFEESSSTPPPWDYFGLSHPIDNQFSSPPVPPRVGNGHVSSSVKGEDEETREVEEEEEEEDGENFSFQEREESNNGSDDDDEFDEPTSDTLVRSFENFNRVRQREGAESEKSKTPELSPPVTPLAAATPLNKTPNHTENNRLPPPRDFLSSMKEVEMLFVRASETGKEVPRMLEANKLHFRPIAQSNQSGTGASSLFKTCLSCGEDPKDVPEEEAAPNTMKYLTWHRTESSRSSSSLNPLGGMNSDDVEELNSNLFENIGIIAGSHASTLDRLYAWERKLYDEVKGSQAVRREYDDKCKILRELESEGKGSKIIDKTRSVVKDLHSRIRVAIHRIDSISRRIEELRDNELQPQLEELIQGLSRMWEVMFECHKAQFQLISACHRRGNIKLNMQSELHRQVTSHLESELSALASSLTKWITGQRSYIKAIHEWLEKCVVLPRPSKRKRRAHQQPVLRNLGPPIYATCAIWLEKLEALPAKEVSGSIKALASDVARFLPRQEKNRSKKHGSDHMLRDETLEDCGPGFDRFRTSLEVFAGQLNQFAESSVKMYEELEQGIQEAKISYEQWRVANGGFL